ncbi:hypothetical protein PP182_04305 [Maribacter sp. PR1]|uniref:Uncharacterized protein n=1 Tax=Maribacter cobaltidurans TaxID=1178778 RepID=A0ABU7IQP8_9FLAO|nr:MULTISPECIES: hypothetical protein [Maribacter]MDC6387887.1 hypothetical protein [Maribacter sp. PR1]MEE1975276.1 hypothetical protein [Maribacter cobaltidurans]
MKLALRIILIFTLFASIYLMLPAIAAFNSITSDPEGWMGGISAEATMVWFAVILLGFGFLGFVTILALIGAIFGRSNRKSAFWLFKLPGILGIILSLLLFIVFYLWDIEWSKHSRVFIFLTIPFLIYAIYGHYIRKSNPKKTASNVSTN